MGIWVTKAKYLRDLNAVQVIVGDITKELHEVGKFRLADSETIKALREDLKLRTRERDTATEELSQQSNRIMELEEFCRGDAGKIANTESLLEELRGKLAKEQVSHERTKRAFEDERTANRTIFDAANKFLGVLGNYMQMRSKKLSPKQRVALNEQFHKDRQTFENELQIHQPALGMPIETGEPIAADRGQSF